jgi:hypothetical protein
MAYTEYVVRQGDSISGIASQHGLFPETVWNDPKNSELKSKRKDPNVLLSGDIVYVRDKERKEESCACDQKHRFKRKGVPDKLILQLLEDGKPRKNMSYILLVDGVSRKGTTDGDGYIRETIMPGTKEVVIQLDEGEEIKLNMGHLDPIDEVSGAKARLNNLGYFCGEVNGELDDATRAAVKSFQGAQGLEQTGELDGKTKSKLKDAHGS